MVRLLSMLTILFAVTVGALVVTLFDSDRSLERLQRSGAIRIGYAVEAPYAFVDGDGVVRGEAPEIAARVAGRLGFERLAWRQMPFGELIGALLSDRIDVIAAGMFVTPERQRQVLFSTPTLAVRPALLVARGNPKGIVSYEQAARDGMLIAVLQGAVEERTVDRAFELADAVDRFVGALKEGRPR